MKQFAPYLTASINRKGVPDVDTVKGCSTGMAVSAGGCYGICYAAKMATLYGYDFSTSVSRKPLNRDRAIIARRVASCSEPFFRIGTMGDPSHDWDLTAYVCEWLGKYKTPVIITKHWREPTAQEIARLKSSGAVVNTSISALDTEAQRAHRIEWFNRLKSHGVRSVLRVVTMRFGKTEEARRLNLIQTGLIAQRPQIDNPLRIPFSDPRVESGLIEAQRHADIGGGSTVSIHNKTAYLGKCCYCQDKCGARWWADKPTGAVMVKQMPVFEEDEKYVCVKSVIGSGYEQDVAKLALEDGIAERAARKNMQIHSAIIFLVNDAFAGFFTFQINDDSREFCLLQSVIKPELYTPERYEKMVLEVLNQNVFEYPALITTNPKSKFETPKLFESVGFKTYLEMSGFAYMVYGELSDVRMKVLAHITMTNVWNSVSGKWLNIKREWNAKIEEAGAKREIPNPLYASREGCWQGENGFANVVTGHSHNGNASVLDPVACEVILRFFTPKNARRVYNPFGGGVQFGFVAGSYGLEYIASEIRQNQCDANNAICADLNSATWIKSDSATYEPDGMFDLVFTCPPYYRVEKYIDYEGVIPEGEINNLDTYEKFRDTLFAGYRRAIEHLNDNCFFVVMTGDSRGKDGGYHCHESETEIFMMEQGLKVYNKIIFLESEFTRLAHAKKTLHHRKFPKREQKIIVAFKGDPKNIKGTYPEIGRL